ncbi:MAG: hypothetical protein GKS03_00515 [Alphaproteobacteria bacterium]|nr:hypothetical protein [Alphaproteobacteria bacterium]
MNSLGGFRFQNGTLAAHVLSTGELNDLVALSVRDYWDCAGESTRETLSLLNLSLLNYHTTHAFL